MCTCSNFDGKMRREFLYFLWPARQHLLHSRRLTPGSQYTPRRHSLDPVTRNLTKFCDSLFPTPTCSSLSLCISCTSIFLSHIHAEHVNYPELSEPAHATPTRTMRIFANAGHVYLFSCMCVWCVFFVFFNDEDAIVESKRWLFLHKVYFR